MVGGVWKKFQMTNLTMPNNFSSMKHAEKSVPGLADGGVPMGMGMAPELHPDGWRGSGKSFKLLILLCLTTSLSQSMLKNQSLALLMLRSPMGMGMAPELQPNIWREIVWFDHTHALD